MSNAKWIWFARGVVVAAVVAAGAARAEAPGEATWSVQQDVVAEKAPAQRAEKAEAGKAPPGEAAKPLVVDESARVIRAKYAPGAEGQGQQK